MAYVYALDDAVQATLNDPAKFDRLAARMGASSADAKSDLRKRFESDAERVHSIAPAFWSRPHPGDPRGWTPSG